MIVYCSYKVIKKISFLFVILISFDSPSISLSLSHFILPLLFRSSLLFKSMDFLLSSLPLIISFDSLSLSLSLSASKAFLLSSLPQTKDEDEMSLQFDQLCVTLAIAGLLSGFVAGLDLLKQSYLQNFLMQTNTTSDKDKSNSSRNSQIIGLFYFYLYLLFCFECILSNCYSISIYIYIYICMSIFRRNKRNGYWH